MAPPPHYPQKPPAIFREFDKAPQLQGAYADSLKKAVDVMRGWTKDESVKPWLNGDYAQVFESTYTPLTPSLTFQIEADCIFEGRGRLSFE